MKRAQMAAVLMSVGLLVTACGSNDADTATGSSSPPVSASVSTAAPSDSASAVASSEAAPASSESVAASSEPQPAKASGEKINLTYAIFSEDQKPAMQKVVDAFTAANPNISVELQVTPWVEYWNKLQIASSGGTGPDVAWMLGAKFGPYADGGALQPLDDAIAETQTDVSKYPAPLVELYKRDSKTYALPKDFDTIGLWYNKKLFDDAGVTYPDATWTWDTLVEAAKKLTDKDKGVFGIAAALDAQAGYYNTIYQAGGSVISADGKKSGYDDPNTIRGLQVWPDLINKHKVSPTLQSLSDTEAVAQFMSGKVAMLSSGSWYAKRFADDAYTKANVDVAKLPKADKEATIINGLGNVAFAGSKHPKEAAHLAVFLSGEEAAKIQSATGTVVGSYEGSQTAWVDAAPFFNLKVFLEQVPNAVVYPVSKNTDCWASKESELLGKAWTGGESTEAAAKKLAKVMNDCLAKE